MIAKASHWAQPLHAADATAVPQLLHSLLELASVAALLG
jgi:hypothetical protein